MNLETLTIILVFAKMDKLRITASLLQNKIINQLVSAGETLG